MRIVFLADRRGGCLGDRGRRITTAALVVCGTCQVLERFQFQYVWIVNIGPKLMAEFRPSKVHHQQLYVNEKLIAKLVSNYWLSVESLNGWNFLGKLEFYSMFFSFFFFNYVIGSVQSYFSNVSTMDRHFSHFSYC